MRKVWLVLLSLGLIAVFSSSAMAVDVKVGGEFFAAGMYLNKTTLEKDLGVATAFYYQRLRMKTDFIVSPGLTLTARMDIMDRQWGARTSAAADYTPYGSAGTRREKENIAFDWLYLTYISPVGMFQVGAMDDYAWGTVFGDASKPSFKVSWIAAVNNLIAGVQIIKEIDNSPSAVNTSSQANDNDLNAYAAFLIYNFKNGSVGYLFRYNRDATNKTAAFFPFTVNVFSHVPYFKVKLGPVALEGEANYLHGAVDFAGPLSNVTAKVDSWEAYLSAKADFGIAYVGGTFAWLPGQINPDEAAANFGVNATRLTGMLTGGTDWNPCLIMWNNERSYRSGSLSGWNGSTVDNISMNGSGMSNAYFFQLKGGVKPVDKLDINLAVSYANATVKPAGFLYNDYGWEIDATATYKITNNLSYMLGGGYLFTGKYFKGTQESNNVQDDYLILNKLTLTF